MNNRRWIDDFKDAVDIIVSAIIALGFAWFIGHFFLLIIHDELTDAATRYVDMIVGVFIGLIGGAYTKIMLDAFTNNNGHHR